MIKEKKLKTRKERNKKRRQGRREIKIEKRWSEKEPDREKGKQRVLTNGMQLKQNQSKTIFEAGYWRGLDIIEKTNIIVF